MEAPLMGGSEYGIAFSLWSLQAIHCNKSLWSGGEMKNNNLNSRSISMKENIQGCQRRLPWGGALTGCWGCWSLRAACWEKDPRAWLAMYLGFLKSHSSLILAGPFHSISLSFPFLSEFSSHPGKTHKMSSRGDFCPVRPLLSGVLDDWVWRRVVGDLVITSYPAAFCFPQAYLYSARSEGTEFGTISNFQRKNL